MRWPRVLAAVAAWLVVVVGTSTLVWVVISRAGTDLSPSEPPQAATTASSGPRPSGSSSPIAAGTRRTWQGPAGFVIATCERGTIRLISAQPVSGFHVEVKDNGGEKLEVEFEAREDRRGGDVAVVARCVSGVPKFTYRADGD
jgi:hypothetical protein